jgi:hypothetical protein
VLFAQKTIPKLSNITDKKVWVVHNRAAVSEQKNNETVLYFNAQKGDGLAVFQDLEFENGVIEFDVKGKNVPGKSFVGIAFHIQDEETFNAVYFRPFNFKNPDKARSGHSVQYICHPDFPWHALRKDFPEQFENPVNPIPNPEDWFHAKVVVQWPTVKVFVEKSKESCLEVQMKSAFKKGKVGFWAGNGSDGAYKNLIIKPLKKKR